MNILYVGFSTNGAMGDNYKLLGKYLSKIMNVFVLTNSNVNKKQIPRTKGFLSIYFDRKKILTFINPYNYLKIIKYIIKNKIDIIFFETPHPVNILISLIFFYKKQVVFLHDPILHSGLNNFDKLFLQTEANILYKTCNKFIVSSNSMKKLILENHIGNIPENKINVIYLGTLENLLFKITQQKEDIDILFFGRIEYYKGLDILIDAINHIKIPNINVVIAGKGNIRKVYKNIEIIPKNITIINKYVEDIKLAELITRSKVIILPYRDATGTQIISTVYNYKKPIIATNVGCFNEYISHMKDGIIVQPENKNKLLEALYILLKDERLRKDMGKKGFEKSKLLFNNSLIANEYKQLFESLL